MPASAKSKFDSVMLESALREDRLMLLRNISYGAAAACLVVLAGLAQVGAKETALKLSVFGCVVGAPMWLLFGGCLEYYLLLGRKSYQHFQLLSTRSFFAITAVLGCLGLFAGVSGIAWFLIPAAGVAFFILAAFSVFFFYRFTYSLAAWWFSDSGPGEGT
jgi:hypothetical protein